MTATRQLCVIIPVYRPVLSAEEKRSLLACHRHLGSHDCFLVYPEGLSPSHYTAVHPGLILKPVPPAWLSSLQHYNRMKVDPAFYALFRDYRFMMTYELDAYIFSADIAGHHGFDYDFIGAPIFEGYMDAKPDAPFLKALNSGFSIRNIAACMAVLEKLGKYRGRWKMYKTLFSAFPFLRGLTANGWRHVVANDHLRGYFSGGYFNEDMIWTQVVPELFPSFKTAPPEKAAAFSFEVNAERLYRLNGNRLPLGCHAWAKFPSFWKRHIPAIA